MWSTFTNKLLCRPNQPDNPQPLDANHVLKTIPEHQPILKNPKKSRSILGPGFEHKGAKKNTSRS